MAQDKTSVAAFMSYLKTNREEIQNYNEKLISSGEYDFVTSEDGVMYPDEMMVPEQPGVEKIEDIVENSLHQLHHDEREVKKDNAKAGKEDLEDKFLAWHRGHLFDSLARIAKDNGFTLTAEQLEKELTPEINAILATDDQATEGQVLSQLLGEYPTNN